ELK
ncbi:response regulator, partial [Vibrio parahaemolyticus EKP-021]